MIINFSVENWGSFKNRASLNMTAGQERQHRERTCVAKNKLRLLPVAAIYGANAAGKTKLIQALSFLQDLIVRGVPVDDRISVNRFRLDPNCLQSPAKFSIDLLLDEKIYSYRISLTTDYVAEESLTIEESRIAYDVFKRVHGQEIKFDEDFFKADRLGFMRVIAQAARDNQPFITTAVQLKAEEFSPLYKWLAEKLTILTPHSSFVAINRFADVSDALNREMVELTKRLGTGIEHFEAQLIHDASSRNIPESLIEEIKSKLLKGGVKSIRYQDLYIRRENDELVIQRLVAVHKDCNGKDIPFLLKDESDGTQRLIDLVPLFVSLCHPTNQVYVIDELDRSLHTQLLEWLLTYYLDSCSSESRNQLIFTTHDVNLLTQDIFRRDELWGVDKNTFGASELYSFRDFKNIRSDKNIRKLYLNGLLGAVPDLG